MKVQFNSRVTTGESDRSPPMATPASAIKLMTFAASLTYYNKVGKFNVENKYRATSYLATGLSSTAAITGNAHFFAFWRRREGDLALFALFNCH